MKETIEINVVTDKGEKPLEFVNDNDVIAVRFNGQFICEMDWNDNLRLAIKRMLEIWS